MDQQSTEIFRPDVRTAIYLLTYLCLHSIKTCSDCALKEMAASDTFLALDDSVDETTMGEDCCGNSCFASSIKAVDNHIRWGRSPLLFMSTGIFGNAGWEAYGKET